MTWKKNKINHPLSFRWEEAIKIKVEINEQNMQKESINKELLLWNDKKWQTLSKINHKREDQIFEIIKWKRWCNRCQQNSKISEDTLKNLFSTKYVKGVY